jgi:oligoribonuclease (3'-5' exoribonuclease)
MEVSSHHVLWVDLETTGADLEDNYILELGAVLTDESADIDALLTDAQNQVQALLDADAAAASAES